MKKNKKTKKLIYVLDSLMILLNIAGQRGNYLLFLLTGLEQQFHVTCLVSLIDAIYIPIRFKGLPMIRSNWRYLLPVFFFIMIPVVNILNRLLDNQGLGTHLAFFIHQVFFIFLLIGLAKEYLTTIPEKGPSLLTRGYIWLVFISVAGVFLSFALIKTIGFSQGGVHADYLESNLDRIGFNYYWCYFTMVMQEFTLRIPFFQDDGYLMGLYHEPHLFAYSVFPALILLLGIYRKKVSKYLIIAVIVLSFLFSGSITSMLSLTACLATYFVINSRRNLWTTLLGVMIVIGGVILFLSLSDSTFIDFVEFQMDDSGSKQYSESTLMFAFTPKTLLGSNILSPGEYIDELRLAGIWTSDVGYVCFLLNVSFILSYVINVIKLVTINDALANAVGYASMYYLLHSAKIGVMVFINVIPLLLVFLQYMTLVNYGRRKTVKKTSQLRTSIEIVR